MKIEIEWNTEDIISHIQEEFNITLDEDQANNILERFEYYSNQADEKEADYNLIEKCYFAWIAERTE